MQFYQFSFRWFNCLLMREVPFSLILRIWDTCIAEERDGFEGFYVYISAALLMHFAAKLKLMKFGEMVSFLQKLPTNHWQLKDIEALLSQAFVYKTLYSK